MAIGIKEALLLNEWYRENKRKLPWRDTGNPYDVWLSEIMLQQTRIEAVIPKFLLFKKELPDIKSLAECSEDHLMRLWEGLGYYSRARNLKKCAAVLMESYNGQLPSDYGLLIKLPGIGPYTAGAIASVAFGQPVPAIDGNVLRVMARVCHIETDVRDKKTHQTVETMLKDVYQADESRDFYSDFNQGLMELGETVCIPDGVPACGKCPWNSICVCHRLKDWDRIPFRSSLKKRKIIERTILIIRHEDLFLLHKRPDTGLLAGLYEFIGTDGTLNDEEGKEEVRRMGLEPLKIRPLPASKHVFTHLEWHMQAYEISVKNLHISRPDYIAVSRKEIQKLAIPSAFKKYVSYYKLR